MTKMTERRQVSADSGQELKQDATESPPVASDEPSTESPVPDSWAELSPEYLAALYPDFPPETICVNCGRRFDDESQCHEIWKDDPCYFDPNTDAERLGRIRREVRHLLDLGMTVDEIENAVRQTAVILGKDSRR